MRALLAVVLAVMLAALPVLRPSSTALACSGDIAPADADVLIAGHVVDLQVVPAPDTASGLASRVTFNVDRYLLASGPDTLVAVDENSLVRTANGTAAELIESGDYEFAGAAGACGALDGDPRGQYWVVGFLREADGTLKMNRLLVYGTGTDAADPEVRDGIAVVEESLREVGLQPAPAGTAGLSGDGDGGLRPAEMVALLLAAGAVVLLGRYTTGRLQDDE